MADDKPKRTTSFAKSLDNEPPASQLADEFNQAAAGAKTPPFGDRPPERHQPAPQQHLTPSGPTARRVERVVHRDKQAREDKLAREINDALNKKMKQRLGLEREHDRGRDR